MVFDNEISTQIVSLFIIVCMAFLSFIHSLALYIRDAAQYRFGVYVVDDAHTHTRTMWHFGKY